MMLSEMLTAIGDRLDYEDSPPTAVTRRLTGFINSTQRQILREKGMSALRRRVVPFVTVAGDPYAVLPTAMTQVLLMVDRTNDRRIIPKDLTWIWERDPGLTLSGPPDVFAVLNYASAVIADPLSTGEAVEAVSSSGADITQTLYVQGITATGAQRSGTIALNGAVPSALPGINNWVQITRWWLSGNSAGTVTLSSASGIELGSVVPRTLTPRYTRVQLNPTPTAVQTLYAFGFVEVPDIVETSDQSLIPVDFVDVLIEGALEKEYLKREKPALAGACRGEKLKILALLRSYLQSPQAAKGENANGFSALGPWFPAGS